MDDVAGDGEEDEDENCTPHSSSHISNITESTTIICLRAARSAGIDWFLGRLKQIVLVGDALLHPSTVATISKPITVSTSGPIYRLLIIPVKVRVLHRQLHKLL